MDRARQSALNNRAIMLTLPQAATLRQGSGQSLATFRPSQHPRAVLYDPGRATKVPRVLSIISKIRTRGARLELRTLSKREAEVPPE